MRRQPTKNHIEIMRFIAIYQRMIFKTTNATPSAEAHMTGLFNRGSLPIDGTRVRP